jgi:hypothetical protein
VKQGIDISFAQGLDLKTDPKRVAIGNFLKLENTIFSKGGLLQKRNGYGLLADLPDTTYSYLTTLNGNLTAIGPRIAAYNEANMTWVAKGAITPMAITTLPIIRNNLNQTACDSAVAPNGLVCTVYLETNGSTTTNKYVIADSVTGQNIVAPTVIPVSSGTVSGGMRVFVLGNYFVLVFTNDIGGTYHLQYVAISVMNPAVAGTNTDIAASYMPASTLAWDGYVVGTKLFVAYDTTSGGQAVKVTYLNATLGAPVAATTFAGQIATMMTVTADTTASNPVIYVSYYNSGSSTGYSLAVDQNLNVVMTPQEIIASGTFLNLASAAQNGMCWIFGEVANNYAWDSSIPTHFIDAVTVTAMTSTVGTPYVAVRSVGLASKAFIISGQIYFLGAFQSPYQPTYFLINGSTTTAAAPQVAAKLAYENGGGYLTTGLPGATVTGTTAQFAYLYKDLIAAVNKNTAVPAGNQVAGIYSQTGINLATLAFGTTGLDTAEIGQDLHITGGFLWMYDGNLPVEHNFFLYPDTDIANPADQATWSDTGGAMAAKPDGSTNDNAYYYQFTYEWTDNQGNAFRSAPSIPIAVTTTGSGTAGSVTLHIPTLRLTYKIASPVKLVVYRWSVAQEVYYQTTSISSPLLNDPTVDTVTFVDTNADATILGNNIIYTNGGVLEDVNAPASNIFTLFDTRLWIVDAEDQNLLWPSKQVIEATPVEMSDLLTIFIPQTVGTNIPTGPIKSLSVMDDKLIIGKTNAFVYMNGTGPDNTGENGAYSPPIFITASVGCANQQSFVLIPSGLMFQSSKGIWLLGRDLSTQYIGAPVEALTTGATVISAVSVPETNFVLFVMDSGITILYDYFYGQWGTFVGVPAVSSCIYQNLHTFINKYGAAYQETPGKYLDGSNPVLMAFTTGPIRIGGLQGYQRAFFFYLLGEWISPHKLFVEIYYDYNEAPSHSTIIVPPNNSPAYGQPSPYGQGNPYGGPGVAEQWRIFLNHQRCQAFGISVQEIFDPTQGLPAGAGLTLSGINAVCAFKKPFRPIPAAQSVG